MLNEDGKDVQGYSERDTGFGKACGRLVEQRFYLLMVLERLCEVFGAWTGR